MKTTLWAVWCSLAVVPAFGAVVTYPATPEEPPAADYQVQANGQPVAVYGARTLDPPFAGKQWDYGGPYAFANFDTDGPVEVRITSRRSLEKLELRPARPEVQIRRVDEHTVVLALPGPRQLSFEPDGRRGPLLLFANPPEPSPPRAGDPGVLFFGPGVHTAGRISVTNGQTLYLAGGAVVKGGVIAEGENLRITGRGILDGSDYEWRKGPTPHVISIRGTNVEVSGITIRGASHWTIVPRDSRRVTVRGVKLCGGRVQNDDGINPCNSQEVLITDCFIRTDDDCVAMKGLEFRAPNSNVERVRVENCILWCDRARIFLLGHESRAPFMRQITLRHLDIIHCTMTPFLFEPGEEMRLEDVMLEDIRVHGEGQAELLRLRPVVNQYMRNPVPGSIRGVHVRNLAVSGAPGRYRVQVAGADAAHAVRDVRFENVEILGVRLTADSERVQLGAHAANVEFTAAGSATGWQVGTPVVTYWAGPALSDATARQMAEGGWNLVWCGEKDLDTAQRHGLRAQLTDPLLAPSVLDDPAREERLNALVERVRRHPALYAYFLTDEPNATNFPALGRMVAHLAARDPAHLAYINLFPTYASNQQLGNPGDRAAAYTAHLREYVRTVKPDLISYDHYQFSVRGDTPDYFLNLAFIRRAALAAGRPFLNIVQACTWTPSMRVPTGDEMRYLVYTTLAYGAQGISYYVYGHPGHTGGIAHPDGSPTPLYPVLSTLNREFVALARQLQPLRSLAVHHLGMQPPGATPLPSGAAFVADPPVPAMDYQPPEPVRGILLGCFGPAEREGDPAGATHAVVVNLDYRTEATVNLRARGLLETFEPATGQWTSTGRDRIEIHLPQGGGRLLRVGVRSGGG